MKERFCIAGGDLRSVYLAKSLFDNGKSVSILALGKEKLPEGIKVLGDEKGLCEADFAVLPLPCENAEGFLNAPFSKKKIPLSSVLENMKEGSVLMGGIIPPELREAAVKKGIEVFDFLDREEFAVRNAALTAEAAAAMAMEMLSESISSVPVLILGHGRIGRLLSAIMKALDAKVTVAARRFSDLAWIRSEGMNPLEFRLLDEEIGKYPVIFNTVPAPVIGRERLVLMKRNAVIIDLASEPGGTDFEAAAELGITAKKALGLPGKFAPKTAGEIIRETVLNIISEREENNAG